MNTGLILKIDERDYLSSDLIHNIFNVEDWFKYYSEGELQHGAFFDTAGCTGFALNKIKEAIMNYQIENKMMSEKNIKWLGDSGYFKNGKINLSDRYLVAKSGTTEEGNTANNVLNVKGSAPESACTWDRSINVIYEERFADWFRNPDNITMEAELLAEEFSKRFSFSYGKASFEDLEHSPLFCFIPTSCEFDNYIQQYCDGAITHAVSLIKKDDLHYKFFDHYIKNPNGKGNEKFLRITVNNYKIYKNLYTLVLKENLTENNMLELIQGENERVYAIGKNSKITHIYNEQVFEKGRDLGLWGDWKDIKKVSQKEIDEKQKENTIAFLI